MTENQEQRGGGPADDQASTEPPRAGEWTGKFPPDQAAAIKLERDALARLAERLLGGMAKDCITGFSGRVTATSVTMFHERRALIERRASVDGVDAQWFDIKRVQLLARVDQIDEAVAAR